MHSRDATRTYDPDERWSHLADQVARSTDPFTALRADQVAQWSAGDLIPAEEYLERFPQLSPDDQLALVVAEIGLRNERGHTFDLAGYQARFPTMANDLALQYRLMSALALPSDSQAPTLAPGGPAEQSDATLPEIPGFTVEVRVGEGAMGEVYRAVQLPLNRLVALKLPHGGRRVGQKDLIRFLAEAESIAAIKHPNVVQVYDYGSHAGLPYLALEYLPGGSLTDRLKAGGRLLPRDAATLVAKLADGVQAAHNREIVHRDLKPGNILFDETGEPKVTDFGLAKRGTGSDLTGSQAVMGTPAYMSPEQARGESKFAGPPADIWALGVILYECLTGIRPFDGEEAVSIAAKVMGQEPLPPRRHVPHLPRDLETICLKCLEKEQSKRYATAEALADDLRRFLGDRPILARRASAGEQAWRWARRNPAVASLLASVAVLLVLLAGGGLFLAGKFKEERDTAEDAKTKAEASERERERELFRATINEVRARRAAGLQGQRFENLSAIQKLIATLPPEVLTPENRNELRDEALACLTLPDVREVAAPRAIQPFNLFGIDSDQSLDVFTFEDPSTRASVVRRWSDPTADVHLPSAPLNLTERTRALSADGKWLAELLNDSGRESNSRFRVWDWVERRAVIDVALHTTLRPPSFHLESHRVAVLANENAVVLFDLKTGAEKTRSAPRFHAHLVKFSPDGRFLVVVSDSLTSEVLDAQTLQSVGVIPFHGSVQCAWHPNSREVALGNRVGEVYVWNQDTRSGRVLNGLHLGLITSLHYTATGQHLISSADDLRTFVRDPVRGEPVLTIQGELHRCAAEGHHFAILRNHNLMLYELATAGDSIRRELRGWFASAEFDPLGRWLVTSGDSGVGLYSPETLKPVGNLGLDQCSTATFRPDGKELVTYGLFSHVLRWPLSAATSATRVGPPTVAMPPRNIFDAVGISEEPQRFGRHAEWSRDGRLLAWTDDRFQNVYVADAKQPRGRVLAPLNTFRVAVSPDGALVAATVPGSGLHLLRVADGATLLRIPDHNSAAFSPDGRRLISASSSEFQFRRTDTWEVERVIPREDHRWLVPIVFRNDGRFVALPLSMRKLALVNPETGVTVLTITHPELTSVLNLCFNPAGDQLAVVGSRTDLQIWNLTGIHAELAKLGLAWNWDDTPSRAVTATSPAVEIDRGNQLPNPSQWYQKFIRLAQGEAFQGRYADAIGQLNGALRPPPANPTEHARVLSFRADLHRLNNTLVFARDDWRAALVLAPNLHESAQGMARLLVLGPPELHDPHQGLWYAQANFQRNPGDAESQLILGAAYARSDRHREALDMLLKIDPDRRGPLDGYLRAICQHHLGNPETAKTELRAAHSAHERVAPRLAFPLTEELRHLREEAERVVK